MIMPHVSRRHIDTALQFSRYAAVGALNTLLTLGIIFMMKGVLHFNPWISNAAGYVAGFINSFIWNKNWVFRSHNATMNEAVKFCIGFLICYALQFVATWILTEHTGIGSLVWQLPGFSLSGYALATLMGMAVYTCANYIFNRLITFRQ
ncbi:MAG: GtrA family protein [Muribaculaceae bacterium]|nr:GtrA family protein [Muribaculaceae bacterium]